MKTRIYATPAVKGLMPGNPDEVIRHNRSLWSAQAAVSFIRHSLFPILQLFRRYPF